MPFKFRNEVKVNQTKFHFKMSKSELHAFIDRARADESFRDHLKDLNPQQIVDFALEMDFNFQMKLKAVLSINGRVFISVHKQ